MENQPWIVIFPGMTADAPVYSNEEAARAMVERTNGETAGNVEAVAMPLGIAAAAPELLSAAMLAFQSIPDTEQYREVNKALRAAVRKAGIA